MYCRSKPQSTSGSQLPREGFSISTEATALRFPRRHTRGRSKPFQTDRGNALSKAFAGEEPGVSVASPRQFARSSCGKPAMTGCSGVLTNPSRAPHSVTRNPKRLFNAFELCSNTTIPRSFASVSGGSAHDGFASNASRPIRSASPSASSPGFVTGVNSTPAARSAEALIPFGSKSRSCARASAAFPPGGRCSRIRSTRSLPSAEIRASSRHVPEALSGMMPSSGIATVSPGSTRTVSRDDHSPSPIRQRYATSRAEWWSLMMINCL